jgi:hypothetical protein
MDFLRKTALIFGAICPFLACAATNGQSPSFNWINVETSPLILEGKFSIDQKNPPVHEFLTLRFSHLKAIKGKIDQANHLVPYFLSDDDDFEEIKNKEGKDLIVFAMPCANGRGDICLMNKAKESLFFLGGGSLKKIEEIVKENERFYRLSTHYSCAGELSNAFKIDQMLDRLDASEIDQQQSVQELLALGEAVVPTLICLMPRGFEKFNHRGLIIPNGSNAFEQNAMYSPKLKVDAIDAILSSVTGIQFLPLANGATDEEREETIRGWMIYLQRLRSK